MEYKFCNYCGSLIKTNKKCSNRKCIFGDKNGITVKQKQMIEDVCKAHKLKLPFDLDSITKEQASKVFQGLLKQIT